MMPIRPLTRDNRAVIHKMLSKLGAFNQEKTRTAMDVIDEALRSPDEGSSILDAHLHQGDLLGFICFGPPIPLTEGCYDLYWITVDEKFCRGSIGSELMLSMEEELLQNQARRIYIDISSTLQYEPARLFYEKWGFQVDSILNDYYRPGDD